MPVLSRRFEETLRKALGLASAREQEYATLEHLLLALTYDDDARDALIGCGVDTEELQAELTVFIDNELDSLKTNGIIDAKPTAGFQRVVQRAAIHIQASGREEIRGENALIALFSENESNAAYFLNQQDINRLDVLNYLVHGIIKAPEIPEQKEGIKFTLRNQGKIDLCTNNNGAVKYDIKLASTLQKRIVRAAERLIALLQDGIGHNAFADLSEDAQEYLEAIRKPLDLVDFGDVWALGVHLQKRADAAADDIEDRLLPELEDNQRSALGALLVLHGPFVLGSRDGRELFEASQRYQGTKGDASEYREFAKIFSTALQQSEKFVASEAIRRLKLVNRDVGTGRFPEREIVTSQITNLNFLSVVGWASVCFVAQSVAGGLIENIAAESIFGKDAIEFGRMCADEAFVTIKFAAEFLIDNEALLLGLSASCPDGFGWLSHLISWLKQTIQTKKQFQ